MAQTGQHEIDIPAKQWVKLPAPRDGFKAIGVIRTSRLPSFRLYYCEDGVNADPTAETTGIPAKLNTLQQISGNGVFDVWIWSSTKTKLMVIV